MRKIKILLTTVLIATLVISGMPPNMIYNETNVKAETEDENIRGKEGDYYYEILNDGTVKITGYNRIYLPDAVSPDWATVPSQIAGRNVTCIGSGAFQNCRDVTNINIPDSVTTIESYAFAGTWATVEIPSGIKSIGSCAFSGCGNLSIRGSNDGMGVVTIPQGVTIIEEGVFSNCTWLKEVVIPSSVTSIGEKAFYNCTELTYIKIPINTIIGKDALGGCDKLKIEYETEKPTTENDTTKPIITTPTTTEPEVTRPQKTTVAKVSIAASKVKKVTKKLASKKTKIYLKKVNGAKYQVKVSTTKKFKKKNTVTKKVKKVTFTIKNKKLQNKKTLYVMVRAYKVVDGKTYYGEWSNIKKVQIKR